MEGKTRLKALSLLFSSKVAGGMGLGLFTDNKITASPAVMLI
jgi:hypothetical protein